MNCENTLQPRNQQGVLYFVDAQSDQGLPFTCDRELKDARACMPEALTGAKGDEEFAPGYSSVPRGSRPHPSSRCIS